MKAWYSLGGGELIAAIYRTMTCYPPNGWAPSCKRDDVGHPTANLKLGDMPIPTSARLGADDMTLSVRVARWSLLYLCRRVVLEESERSVQGADLGKCADRYDSHRHCTK